MVIDESIVFSPIKPAVKGVYYTLASKADRFGNVILPYEKIGSRKTVYGYIKELVRMDFIEKKQLIIRKNGRIKKLNKYSLKIKNPGKIPFEVYRKVESLSLISKGLFLSLYAMASDEGYIYSSLKELSEYFSVRYETFLVYINKLQELHLIEKHRGVVRIVIDST